MKGVYESVLIIEDDADLRNLLENILKGRVSIVTSSANLTAALEQVKARHPDVIILDNNLPDGKGVEHIPLFKELSPDVNVILISALPGLSEEARKYGADAYLEKPIRLTDINTLLERRA